MSNEAGTKESHAPSNDKIEELMKSIEAKYKNAEQEHVLKYVPELSREDKFKFLQELYKVPESSLRYKINAVPSSPLLETKNIKAFKGEIASSSDSHEYQEMGEKALAENKVGAILLSGGQGTRLGFNGPKGMVDIGLPNHETLFQLLIQRLTKLKESSGSTSIPLYIMTSPLNNDVTKEYFESSNYFGYNPNDVLFFTQDVIPCYDLNGKFLMETPSKLSMAPNGNGGIYPSLFNSGMINDMKSRSLKYLHVFSIDNALNRPADPKFVGFLISTKSDVGNKVVWKVNANEKVGVMGETAEGKPCIVEYSDLSQEQTELRDDNNKLVFGAGNICNHLYSIEFLEQVCNGKIELPYHIAKKKIPYYCEHEKKTVTPTVNNGIKLETFIFDVFPLCSSLCILEVKREDEFAPVKNKSGADSPESAREMVLSMLEREKNKA